MLNNYAKASLLWAIVSATATSLPGKFIPRITGLVNLIVDNTSHFLIFLVLAYLITRSFQTYKEPFSNFKAFLLAFAISVTYGFCLEIIQIPIPGRAFEWSDALANSLGGILGGIIAAFWIKLPDKE